MGEWILRTACAQAAKWPEPVKVSVNLSATQFKSRNLVQLAINALGRRAYRRAGWIWEITELVLLQDEFHTLVRS